MVALQCRAIEGYDAGLHVTSRSAVVNWLTTLGTHHETNLKGTAMANVLGVDLATGTYHSVDDPADLRVALRELHRIHTLIDQLGELTAEMPDVEIERAAGIRVASTLIAGLITHAENRLDQLVAIRPVRQPVVIDPATLAMDADSPHNLPVIPVITAPYTATELLSTAEAWILPGQRTRAHVHLGTDVFVLVRSGRAVTVWWDEQGRRHELPQSAGQHLHIPSGVPHCAYNPGRQPVLATQVRSNPVFDADIVLRTDLDAELAGIELPTNGLAA